MKQMARNVTLEECGILRDCRYLLHNHDTKFTQSFRATIASGQVEPFVLPARSPNLNAYTERWIRSVKEEILCRCSGRVIPVRCNPHHQGIGDAPDDGPHS
jgi:putative transposase